MEQALRPYVTTGIAVVGATALIAAPVAAPPTLTSLQAFEVQLTAGLDDIFNGTLDFGQLATLGNPTDPIDVYTNLVTNSFTNVLGIGENWIDQPFPIAQAVIGNQIDYLTGAFQDPASILDIPGQMVGNLQNVFSQLTSLTPTLTGGLTDLTLGLPVPLVMGLAALGPLVNGIAGFNTSFGAFEAALNSQDFLTAFTTLVAGPGYVGDAVLNGQFGLDLELGVTPSLTAILNLLGLGSILDNEVVTGLLGALGFNNLDEALNLAEVGAHLPLLNGLLVPMQDGTVNVSVLDTPLLNLAIEKLGGLTDGFVNYLPQQIAVALGGGTLFGSGSIFDALDFGNVLGGFDFADILSGFDMTDILGTFGLAALLGDILPATATGLPADLLGGLLDPGLILGALGL
ncbi:hypothetical protein BHQ15_00570 [Mycolicibacillus koreensis]|nr:hypothetical protein BHQ15_00570 [Mycolicibacillus koreensis]